ncbi:flagellar biosynthetic protein FliO [Gilliamella sp. B2969]|uniref:FliO/MopB family protein n=1 Tax=unclassified Gilliamella TaxID=2685620 RepID=UPI00226A186F|nr:MULTISPECIES: flagellar biosynthetic protein FliO [unclassified Gilliamella]MCX8712957.1 flagellar biosynthetic protein FliO [Gilliamella sp. B3468]MCX8727507.1 flagellar biosynthetic protein FliO [Gilliamella sp. B2838]MCX8730354.1 flagellar biosynthetic protein FliO [Gilliamella sp. B2969]MCX8739204.1 flagellar biosynthetic protein FliO [Gilliamella sp. B2824]MCX8752131.1 flagellar biosynthetic protein FliO [Gilliamella sp. B3464]
MSSNNQHTSQAISTSEHIVPSSSEMNLYTQIATSMGLSFVLVISVILLLGWMVKRLSWKKKTKQLIEVKSTYNLSPKERIILVHVDHQLLVVGVSAQQMTLLHTIDEQRTEMLLSQSTASKESSKNNLFHQLLLSTLSSKRSNNE